MWNEILAKCTLWATLSLWMTDSVHLDEEEICTRSEHTHVHTHTHTPLRI
jgi:hypothetical protein